MEIKNKSASTSTASAILVPLISPSDLSYYLVLWSSNLPLEQELLFQKVSDLLLFFLPP